MLSLLLVVMHWKICRCRSGCSGGRRIVSAVLPPLVVTPVTRVVVGGAAAVPAGVRPRLDVHVHHVRLEGVRAHEAPPAVGAPEKCERGEFEFHCRVSQQFLDLSWVASDLRSSPGHSAASVQGGPSAPGKYLESEFEVASCIKKLVL